MTLVKICGIRTVEEGRAALAAGADYLGFVFWHGSKRATTPAAAASIVATLKSERSDWSAVGVFVDPTLQDVREAARGSGIEYAQLCGSESAAFVGTLPIPAWKVIRVRPGGESEAVSAVDRNVYGADLYLLDSHVDGRYGGTGTAFTWQALASIGPSCFVAGGLDPQNVSTALDAITPRGVDVSSGVELPGGGKDPRLMQVFVEAVRNHDRAHAH